MYIRMLSKSTTSHSSRFPARVPAQKLLQELNMLLGLISVRYTIINPTVSPPRTAAYLAYIRTRAAGESDRSMYPGIDRSLIRTNKNFLSITSMIYQSDSRIQSYTTNNMENISELNIFHTHSYGNLEIQPSTIYIGLNFVPLKNSPSAIYLC